MITSVDSASDAATKGLERGDIITQVNYKPVNTIADLNAAINAAQQANRSAVLLQVLHHGQPAQFLPVRLNKAG